MCYWSQVKCGSAYEKLGEEPVKGHAQVPKLLLDKKADMKTWCCVRDGSTDHTHLLLLRTDM